MAKAASTAPDDLAAAVAGIPRDVAHDINHELLNVLALLHCAMGEVDGIKSPGPAPSETFHDAESRAISLLIMSRDKVRAAVSAFEPYI